METEQKAKKRKREEVESDEEVVEEEEESKLLLADDLLVNMYLRCARHLAVWLNVANFTQAKYVKPLRCDPILLRLQISL